MSDTPNTPETPKKKKNFLIVYVISLLAIALLLLLFSFLQSRRASEQISDLQEEHNVFSTSALQSINNLNDRLGELEAQNQELIAEHAELTTKNARLSDENESLRSLLTDARNELSSTRLDLAASTDSFDELVALLEQLEADGDLTITRDEDGAITGIEVK